MTNKYMYVSIFYMYMYISICKCKYLYICDTQLSKCNSLVYTFSELLFNNNFTIYLLVSSVLNTLLFVYPYSSISNILFMNS